MKKNSEALAAYEEALRKAKVACARISQYLEDNGEIDPEEVNWAAYGSMADLHDCLADLVDMIDKTGEYAR